MRTIIAAQVGLSVLLGILLGCSTPPEAPAPLRVGTSGEYRPFSFVEGGELRGIEIDLARRFASENGRELELVQLPLVDLIPALVDGKIDVIMSGMSVTSQRLQRVQFTESYLDVGQMALVRKAEYEDRVRGKDVDKPENRIGFRKGTTGEKFVRSSVEYAQLVPLTTIDEGVQALRDKRIDYFVHDAPTIWRIVGGFKSTEDELTGLYRPLTDEIMAWAVRKEDRALLQQLNSSLRRWKLDGNLELVLDSWIRVRRVTVD